MTSPRSAPVAVVMITLNEAHNLEAVLDNIQGWAQEVFLVDSYSSDATVDIALQRGVYVVQRRFRGFGDQWNFALEHLPITAPWTMKLDPDERLTDALKTSIAQAITHRDADALAVRRRLWFMGSRLPVRQTLVRVWRTARCRFSDVLVNEYPLIEGRIETIAGELEHSDSPDLHHWFDKQNRYSTAEALATFRGIPLSAEPKLLGSALQRHMWLKRNFWRVPGRYLLMFLYHLLMLGAWRAGRVGWIWSLLRTEVYRMWEYKLYEMRRSGREVLIVSSQTGRPDQRVPQYD